MLFQVQVTVIAILISLSLAAVELAASTYSLRLFHSFSNSPFRWMVIGLYLGSIAFDFSLLTFLTESTAGYQSYIGFSYMLGVIMPFLLIPYWRSMTEILSPESILKDLAKGIPRSSTAFQPIVNMICVSLNNYDYETARRGLEVMNSQVLQIVKSHNVRPLWDSKVQRGSRRHVTAMSSSDVVETKVSAYCGHLERLGKLFARKGEEELTLQTSLDLSRVGYALAEGVYPIEVIISRPEFNSIFKALTAIGSEAAEKRIHDATVNTIENMSGIATAIKYEVVEALDGNAESIASSINKVGRKAIEFWQIDMLFPIVKGLGAIGKLYSEKKFYWATSRATESLIEITRNVVVDGYYLESDHLVDNLLKIHISTSLSEIGKALQENSPKPASERIAWERATEKVAWGLLEVGFWASIRKLHLTMKDCACGLAELARLNERIVNQSLEILRDTMKMWNHIPTSKSFGMNISSCGQESLAEKIAGRRVQIIERIHSAGYWRL